MEGNGGGGGVILALSGIRISASHVHSESRDPMLEFRDGLSVRTPLTVGVEKWAGHVARTEKMRKAYKTVVVKPEEKIPLEDLDILEKIILKCILDKKVWGGGFALVWL